MARERLTGRAVVTYNWAQYVLAAFADEDDESRSQVLVAFDGRFRTCYPQDVIDMHFDFVLGNLGPQYRHRDPDSPAFDASRVLRHARPDLVLLRRSQHNSVSTMEANDREWVLLYSDSVAQLWGRSRRYDDRGSPYFIPPERRALNDEQQTGSVPWPAFPRINKTEELADNR